jgi:hypothetical protein
MPKFIYVVPLGKKFAPVTYIKAYLPATEDDEDNELIIGLKLGKEAVYVRHFLLLEVELILNI